MPGQEVAALRNFNLAYVSFGSKAEPAMRDFILLLAPAVVVVYFLVYPDQLSVLTAWAMNLLR
jgi:hypothetical protein